MTRLTGLIRARRKCLPDGGAGCLAQQQALMALAHLHNGDTLIRLAAGFGVSVTTV